MDKERTIVNFILAAREMARAGVPRYTLSVQNFFFATMGEHYTVVSAGLDPDKIVDEVWESAGSSETQRLTW